MRSAEDMQQKGLAHANDQFVRGHKKDNGWLPQHLVDELHEEDGGQDQHGVRPQMGRHDAAD